MSGKPAVGGSEDALPPQLDLELGAGLEAMRAGDLLEARKHLEHVRYGGFEFVIALENRITIENQLGGEQAGLSLLSTVARQHPGDAEIQLSVAWGYYELGRYADAEAAARQALAIDSRHIEAKYAVGLFHLARGDLGQAIDAYQSALREDRGFLHGQRALESLLRHQALHPDALEVHYGLGFFYSMLGWPELERDELERYLSRNPGGPAAEVARQRLLALKSAAPGR